MCDDLLTNLTNSGAPSYSRPMGATRSILNIYEAKTRLSSLIDRSLAGEDIVIARRGKALVRLVPMAAEPALRSPSPLMTIHWVSDDFDAPDPELEAQFYGGDLP
jgi:antitoxin (DNA-binding transcriptional repressor) of toxin-antitoxin stability system